LVVALAVAGGGAGIAVATGAGDSDEPITGSALEQASAAALAYTGQGTVSDTEVGDEEGAYEVEVTLEDGSQVDVHLDADFNVISEEAEDGAEDEDEDDGDSDD
jgi:uncharacterized membrane protein YkoI